MLKKAVVPICDQDLPRITAVIPCRNEEKHLGHCLESIVANGYPMDRLEVLVTDGMSEDGSRKIVADFHKRFPQIRLVDNPRKILAAAWNVGVKAAKGEIVFAMNAHAKVEEGYFKRCIEYLRSYGADCVGPVIITHPQDETFAGKLIAAAISHPFGVGNSRFRTGASEPTWVDTVHMGGYRREVFEATGYYNEELVRSQDIDFHVRLSQAGGKILLVPEIKVHYYTRSNLKMFLKFGFINGYWATRPYCFGAFVAGLRHLVPMFFFLSLALPLLASFWVPQAAMLPVLILTAYFTLAIGASVQQAIRKRNLAYAIFMPLVFFAVHLPYGIGSTAGMAQALFSKRFWNKLLGHRTNLTPLAAR